MKLKHWLFAAVFFAVLMTTISGVFVNSAYAAKSESATTEEMQALTLLNRDRSAHGLEPLVYNQELHNLAENYADDMIKRGFFAHNNPEGLTPFNRMDRAGIEYKYAGENLALNDTIEAAEIAFMNSPTHRENILNEHYTEVGIGVKHAPNGKVYVVQEFINR
ncbi:CAP domain-containing protein [Anaerosinus massiliensis]|uniref:CAP domain-containing protein n=1 Tax=Massilibacillus massiliensis TaxID=1806837 RepID=UPI000DA60354|nr:CAP domain-containing protein [Massilibacillus massiliensis]